jgi:hypothetical protein
MLASVGDSLFTLTLLLIPVLCILRFRAPGILLGTIAGWLFSVVVDLFLPSRDPESGPIRDWWLRYGWIVVLAYALLIFLAQWAYRKIRPPAAAPPL